ncbi:tetratricopeptide repeat protein [Clostridium tyrobutyricum]|uniref:tetratricopeptide repeat protein n=1 Tax=Clostridium tyrobutyricum TaxID=1519 RepID=UPI001C395C5D|nr:tetratricopeptide repeat protein [Clostridium tyrobutyricum]MBV4439903.1 tetratricopeptide repeat protein [Clostridium tyrobutyricum]
MLDIIKNFASISGVAAFIFAVTYFIIRLPVYESSNINKTEFNKDTVKGLTIVFIVCFILFTLYIGYMIFNNGNTNIEILPFRNYINLYFGYIVLYLYFYCEVEIKKKLIIRDNNNYEKYQSLYEICQLFSVIIILITTFIIVKDIHDYYNMNNYILCSLSFSMKPKNIFNVFFLIKYVFLYLLTMLVVSYIMAYGKLFNFTKYLIFSEKLPDKKLIGYIFFENDEEIVVKCDKSHPIIIKKADIYTYMKITHLAFIGENKKIYVNTTYNGIYKDEFITNELIVDEKSLYNSCVFNKMEILLWILIIVISGNIYFFINTSIFHLAIKLVMVIIMITFIIKLIIFFIRKSSHSKYLYEYNRGNLYYNLHKYEKAIDCYDKAIKFNSCPVDAYKNKRKALFMLDNIMKSN